MKFANRKQITVLMSLLLIMLIVVAGCTKPAPPVTPDPPPVDTPAEPVTEEPTVETEEPIVETPAEPEDTEEPVVETPAEPEESDEPELPMLEITEQPSGGMGYEVLRSKDVSDIITGTPWTEDFTADTLPVFLNNAHLNEDATPTDELLELMQQQLIKVAKGFGVTVNPEDIVVSVNESQPYPNALVSYSDEAYRFETNMLVETTVQPIIPIDLPPEYTFPGIVTKEQQEALAEYLKQEHADWIGLDSPVTIISGGDYTTEEVQLYHLGFYEDSSDETEALLNFHFQKANFSTNDAGQLFHIRIFNTNLSNPLGDYPVITPEEAEEMLLAGRYFTTVPEDPPTAETVRGVTLVYRNFLSETSFLPYYRFLVELPNETIGDMLAFGAYYVPAVEEQFISNLP